MSDEQKAFWTSLPGIFTGLATVVTAVTGLYIAVGKQNPAPPREQPVAQAEVAAPVAAPTVSAPATAETPVAGSTEQAFPLTAVVDAPDGYAYVWQAKSQSSQVVAKLSRDEEFHTYRQAGKWWQVKTRDGKVGYMHISRIRVR